MLACDAAAHRAMLIVGRFLTGRRARQRTACFGTKGLALRSSANIASTDRPVCLIASAAYCRVSYGTVLASIASHGALMHGLKPCHCLGSRAERRESSLHASCTSATPIFETNESNHAETKPARAMNECVKSRRSNRISRCKAVCIGTLRIAETLQSRGCARFS